MHRSWFKLYHENNCIKKIKTNPESFATKGDNGSFHDNYPLRYNFNWILNTHLI